MEKIANFRERVSVSHVEMPRKDIWKSLGAEFLGTFILMVIGCGVGLYTGSEENKPTLVAVALTWGFTVASLAQSLGHVSGCHMNPAVTLAFLSTRKIELVKAGLYIVVQCIASIVAIGVLKALTPEDVKGGFGTITVSSSLTSLQGFGIEFILTFILVFVVFSVSDEHRTDIGGSTPLAIGCCIITLIFFGANLTGAGLNPARVLGPAVVQGFWDFHWIYWVGPIGGGITAGTVYEHVFRNLSPEEHAAALAQLQKSREPEIKESSIP